MTCALQPENLDGKISAFANSFLDAATHCFPKKGAVTITQPTSSQHKNQTWAKKHVWSLLLLLVLVVFAFAAVYNLGYMSVQWDEMPHLNGAQMLARGQTWNYMTTFGYYPPLFDLVTTGSFQVLGINETAGRLVAVAFSVLAIALVYFFTKKVYGQKNALVASVFLGTMPGFFWLTRVTMIETMLIFFFTLVMYTFYSWITRDNYKTLLFSGLTLGLGILAKYQIVVAALAMLLTVLFLVRGRLKISLAKFLLIFVIAVLVVVPWFVMVYHYDGLTKFQTLQYVMTEGGQDRPAYSNRFQPLPVYYLVEMAWPFNDIWVHPISLPIFILGLFGLGLFAYRRSKQDIFFLTWFMVIYVFFTLIPNRQWRYVTPLFPILAVSAACFTLFLLGKVRSWKPNEVGIKAERLKKVAAVLFVMAIAGAVVYSSFDAYQMTARDQINIPLQETTDYLAAHLDQNQSAVLVCAFNLLNQDMFRFYLPSNMSSNQIWQYPALPVDAFTPNFKITEFISLCKQYNAKYIILFDWGPHTKFFNSTLDYVEVQTQIFNSQKFDDPNDRPFFGPFADNKGFRLFLVRFLG